PAADLKVGGALERLLERVAAKLEEVIANDQEEGDDDAPDAEAVTEFSRMCLGSIIAEVRDELEAEEGRLAEAGGAAAAQALGRVGGGRRRGRWRGGRDAAVRVAHELGLEAEPAPEPEPAPPPALAKPALKKAATSPPPTEVRAGRTLARAVATPWPAKKRDR